MKYNIEARNNCGIYGIKDTSTNKIVYVGSTNITFAIRWSQHTSACKRNGHYNPKLSELINSNHYEFVILEITKSVNSKNILDKERYYSLLYDVKNNGYAKNIGGSELEEEYKRNTRLFDATVEVYKARLYIYTNWINKRFGQAERDSIMDCLNSKYGIEVSNKNFLTIIRKLGFEVQRMRTKRDWMITE